MSSACDSVPMKQFTDFFVKACIAGVALACLCAQSIAQDWAFPPATLHAQAPANQESIVVPHPAGGYLALAFHDFRISLTHFGDTVETRTETIDNAPVSYASARLQQTGILVSDAGGKSWFDFSGNRIWKRSGYMPLMAQADAAVILMHNERLLYGLSTADGQTLWTSSAISEFGLQTSVSSGGITYFADEQNDIRTVLSALDHQTGALLWRTNTRLARPLAPVVTDACVLVFTTDADALTNQLECHSKLDGALLSSTEFELPHVHISAVLAAGKTLVVFHGNSSTQIFGAVALREGQIIWRQTFSSDTRKATLAPEGGIYRFAYAPNNSDLLIERRRVRDGSLGWSAPASSTHRISGQYYASAGNARLEIAAFGSHQQTGVAEWFVNSFDAVTGMSVALAVVPSNANSRGRNGVALSGNQVFAAELVASTLQVSAGNAASGAVQWRRQFDSLASETQTPTLSAAADYLTVLNHTGEILRLNRATGALVWRYRNPQLIAVRDAQDLAYVTLTRCADCTEIQQLNASGAVQLTLPNARAIGTIERDVLTVEGTQIVRRNVTGNIVWAVNYPIALIASLSQDANSDLYILNRQFGQLAKLNGLTGETLWSQAYAPSSMLNITQRLGFLGDGTAFVRITDGPSSGGGAPKHLYFRIDLTAGHILGAFLPPNNVLRVSALANSGNSDFFLAPAVTDSVFAGQNVLGRIQKSTLNWLGAQNYTSPAITDLIGSDRSDSFLGLAPDGGVLVARDHYFEAETDESQIWLEHYPPPTDAPAGALTLTQTNSSANAFSDGVIRLRIQNDSAQAATNIAFSAAPVDQLLGCRMSNAGACDLRSTSVGSLRFDLAPHEFADFDFLSIMLPDCTAIIAQMQPAPNYVDTSVDDNRVEIRLCDRFRTGFE